ncbi:aldo/keto reductase [Spongisporangium articulatum]|uniref:Aldo/keto reductase n=1 Tax=Spongisporangium articulatum TaxID=3362603 RepID=A0ABW8APT6_9ACTN
MTTTLGNSDLSADSPLALGCNPFGWTADEATTHRVLDAFTAGGGTLLDTSDSYGRQPDGTKGGASESFIGSWLARTGRRDDVTLITKVSRHPEFTGLAPATITGAVEASLRRLGTDRIDLYFAHFDDPSVPLADTLAAFDALIDTGKVRYYGLSNYTPERIEEAFVAARQNGLREPVCLQPEYNLLEREPFESGYAPLAERENLGTLVYFALASGFLTGKYPRGTEPAGDRAAMVGKYFDERGFAMVDTLREVASAHGTQPGTVALAWLLSRAAVSAPIASARTPEQVPGLLEATTLKLSDDELATLTLRS